MDIKQEAAALEPWTGGGRVKSTLAKVVETGFLVATWLALVSLRANSKHSCLPCHHHFGAMVFCFYFAII